MLDFEVAQPISIGLVLVGYNRPIHFERVFDALSAQWQQSLTVLFDAPNSVQIEEKQEQMRRYINSIVQTPVEVLTAPRHLGVAGCIHYAVDQILKNHEAVIVVEDDCIPLPGFIEYMKESLQKFEEDYTVRSICGYLPPEYSGKNSQFFSRRFIPWGWATWKTRWNDGWKCCSSIDEQHLIGLPDDLAKVAANIAQNEKEFDIWSWRWAISHYISKSKILYPAKALIHNIGFDGSGVHCSSEQVLFVTEAQSQSRALMPNNSSYDQIENFMNRYSDALTLKRNSADLGTSKGSCKP